MLCFVNMFENTFTARTAQNLLVPHSILGLCSMPAGKYVNPYKVFLGQLYANLPRAELQRVMRDRGVPQPDAGLYMVPRSLVGYPVNHIAVHLWGYLNSTLS